MNRRSYDSSEKLPIQLKTSFTFMTPLATYGVCILITLALILLPFFIVGEGFALLIIIFPALLIINYFILLNVKYLDPYIKEFSFT